MSELTTYDAHKKTLTREWTPPPIPKKLSTFDAHRQTFAQEWEPPPPNEPTTHDVYAARYEQPYIRPDDTPTSIDA